MNRQQLLDIVGCLENAVKTAEGKASLPDYFGQLFSRFTIHDDEALVGIIVEIECMGQVMFFNTFLQQAIDTYGSGGCVYISHELAMTLQSFFLVHNITLFYSIKLYQTLSEIDILFLLNFTFY